MKSQAGKQNCTGQVNLFSCTECKILLSGRKYWYILRFMTHKTKYEFFFPSFLLQRRGKITWQNFPFVLPSFCSEEFGEGIAHFHSLFPGANYQVHSEPAVLDSSWWAKPRISLLHPHPPLHKNYKRNTMKIGPTVHLPCSSTGGKSQEFEEKK